MAARKPLPNTDHVARYVPPSKQHRDVDTGEFLQLGFQSLMLRDEDQGGLSVTWIEYFGPKNPQSKAIAAAAYRATLPSGKLSQKGLFATANVQALLDTGREFSKSLRVVHDPVDHNHGHAQVRQFSEEDIELLGVLADTIFAEIDFVSDMGILTS